MLKRILWTVTYPVSLFLVLYLQPTLLGAHPSIRNTLSICIFAAVGVFIAYGAGKKDTD